MASINMASILAKAKACMRSSEQQRKVELQVDKIIASGGHISGGGIQSIHTPEEAADKFIEVLINQIESCAGSDHASGALGGTAISALVNLSHSSPTKVGKNRYVIEVSFNDDLYRYSLVPSKYDGINNIAALLNSGYSAGHTVHGMWHGNKISSLPMRDGAHFIDNAVNEFMSNYAGEYGVVDIVVDDVYQ